MHNFPGVLMRNQNWSYFSRCMYLASCLCPCPGSASLWTQAAMGGCLCWSSSCWWSSMCSPASPAMVWRQGMTSTSSHASCSLWPPPWSMPSSLRLGSSTSKQSKPPSLKCLILFWNNWTQHYVSNIWNHPTLLLDKSQYSQCNMSGWKQMEVTRRKYFLKQGINRNNKWNSHCFVSEKKQRNKL